MINTHEKKLTIISRLLMSFILFCLLVLLSIAVCAKFNILSTEKISSVFTGYRYVQSVKDDITDYAKDIYIKNGLDGSDLDDIISYELVENAANQYASWQFTADSDSVADLKNDALNEICRAFNTDLESKASELYADDEYKKSEDKVRELFKSYADSALSIKITDNIKTVLKLAPLVSNVVIFVLLLFSFCTALILYFIGAKRYRSVRALGISAMSCGVFDLIIMLTSHIIFAIKQIDIYPVYLRNALMDFIYSYFNSVALLGTAFMTAAIILFTAGWKIKRES